ncbi:MAG: DNA translocase FtsK 4TM domain-containing protein [bacterium]
MSRKVTYFLVISLLALSAFLSVALATARVQDWPFASGAPYSDVDNLSGPFGSLLAYACIGLLGRFFAWFVPAALLILAAGVLADRRRNAWRLLFKVSLLLVLLNSFFALLSFTRGSEILSGSLGRAVAGLLSSLLGRIGGTIIIITCLLLVLLTEVRFLGRTGPGRETNPNSGPAGSGRWGIGTRRRG